MTDDFLKKVEKRLRIIFLILAVVAVTGVVLMIRLGDDEPPAVQMLPEQSEETVEQEYDWEMGLSDATYWLPAYCHLYETLPEISFFDVDGNERFISNWKGSPVILMFWESWCEDCQGQMEYMAEYEQLLKSYGDIPILFINKTDGEKETRESALAYFEGLGLENNCYFDHSLKAYNKLGIRNVPTMIFLNDKGEVRAWSPKPVTEKSRFKALLLNALQGNSRATAEFIKKHLMDAEGGVHSDYTPGMALQEGSMVLSESQGLFLLYALESRDRELFDQILSYIRSNMWENGLTIWKVQNGNKESVNALIDDLRIYRAVLQAQKSWGGYEEELSFLEGRLKEFGIKEDKYVDFYDENSSEYARRLTLCYVDLNAMELLSEGQEDTAAAYGNAMQLVMEGQISNEFPLYYSWYNYDKKRYERDDLNTAEAMVTLLNLSRQGLLRNNTVKWLKSQISGEGLKARYNVDGEVVKGYNYESTAVYALVVMIADEIGDGTLRGQALNKMEKTHFMDTALEYNGAFGMEGGKGITSFDQLMPLLAYVRLEEP